MNITKHARQAATVGALILICVGIAGCEDAPPPVGQNFTYNGNNWVISDQRAGQLVIVAVDPRLAGLGTEAAARHPVAPMPEAEYRAAANGWFTTTGRFCTPENPQPNDEGGGYVYQYSCWLPA